MSTPTAVRKALGYLILAVIYLAIFMGPPLLDGYGFWFAIRVLAGGTVALATLGGSLHLAYRLIHGKEPR